MGEAALKYPQEPVYRMTSAELESNSVSLEQLHVNLVNRIHKHYHPKG